ncbi:hypothetical protein Brsp04_01005 [Brucella sp. NBRC 12952]|jgi:predicted small lipoprotein YifL|uniref:Antifreeze protein, type I n=2 Tax=Brucella pseudogrignonensis TaxID=419475 RepID=A0A1A9FK57_9HYPH|nr:hypothetical protein A8A54_06760 [Brucella pseudogrignonensis]EMG54105.1 hypothetical protein WYI_08684 [Ochrobactrum sp. CDB2]OYR29991.1 hypothetical protein CEV34_0473 [Brucella pseudogrignonensis]GLU24994.1 hypothetical protein Brsp01_02270 [Brucella sp. NBRC 12950]
MDNSAVVVNKDSMTAFSMFKRRLSSVMAFVMSRHFLFLISAVVLVALAACGKGEDEQAAAPAQPEQNTSAPAPSSDTQAGPDLMKALQDNAGVITPEQKAAAIERARTNAEAAAKAVGQSVEQAQAAGEAAASAAQQSFEARQAAQ